MAWQGNGVKVPTLASAVLKNGYQVKVPKGVFCTNATEEPYFPKELLTSLYEEYGYTL